MTYKVIVSEDVFKYFKKANSKIQKKMLQNLNKLSQRDIDKLINSGDIKKNNEICYYNIRNNVVVVFIINKERVCVIDYVHEVDDDVYSIIAKGNPFKMGENQSDSSPSSGANETVHTN